MEIFLDLVTKINLLKIEQYKQTCLIQYRRNKNANENAKSKQRIAELKRHNIINQPTEK